MIPSARSSPFLFLWSLAVLAATTAFVVHLAIRVKAVQLGYDLGDAHAEVGRLREVRRVLELELQSHRAPERVERVARQLLGMSEPSVDRIFAAGPLPSVQESEGATTEGDGASSKNDARGSRSATNGLVSTLP